MNFLTIPTVKEAKTLRSESVLLKIGRCIFPGCRFDLPRTALDPLRHINRHHLILDVRVAILETLDCAEAIAELVRLPLAEKDGEAILEQFLIRLEPLGIETLLNGAQIGLSAVPEVARPLSKPGTDWLLLESDTVAETCFDLEALFALTVGLHDFFELYLAEVCFS